MWRLWAPAYGLNDAAVAFRRPLFGYLANSAESFSGVGLRFEASSFDPRLFFVFRKSGGRVGAIATHIYDFLG